MLILPMLGACGDTLDVQLQLYDPCNQAVLREAEHVQLQVRSHEMAQPVSTTWSAVDKQGELPDLPLVDDAIVSVTLRQSNGAGAPGAALAGADVGPVDLTGQDGLEVIDLSLAVGKLDTFATTTDGNDRKSCSSMLAARQGHSATVLPNGKVLIAGGERRNQASATYWETTELYDPRHGTFSQGPEMGGWTRKGHTATLLPDGRVLLAGGIGSGDNVETTWKVAQIYDPTKNVFLEPIKMLEQRAYHTATALDDGRVLLAGGQIDGRELASSEIFDPKTSTFVPGPALHEPRAFHAAVKVGPDTVALIGGRGSSQVLSSVEFVVVGDGTVVDGPTLAKARSHLVAARVPGEDAVVVAGGFDALVSKPELGTGLDSIEVIRVNTQSLAASVEACSNLRLSSGRGAPGIAVTGDAIVVLGGVTQPGLVSATADRIVFESTTTCKATVEPTAGAMFTPRAEPVVTVLAGGDLLVSGGFSVASGKVVSLANTEIYVSPRP